MGVSSNKTDLQDDSKGESKKNASAAARILAEAEE
jgi:hypothetical protein